MTVLGISTQDENGLLLYSRLSASLEEPRSRRRTLTENVQSHGARVISQRFWQSAKGRYYAFNGEFGKSEE